MSELPARSLRRAACVPKPRQRYWREMERSVSFARSTRRGRAPRP